MDIIKSMSALYKARAGLFIRKFAGSDEEIFPKMKNQVKSKGKGKWDRNHPPQKAAKILTESYLCNIIMLESDDKSLIAYTP